MKSKTKFSVVSLIALSSLAHAGTSFVGESFFKVATCTLDKEQINDSDFPSEVQVFLGAKRGESPLTALLVLDVPNPHGPATISTAVTGLKNDVDQSTVFTVMDNVVTLKLETEAYTKLLKGEVPSAAAKLAVFGAKPLNYTCLPMGPRSE